MKIILTISYITNQTIIFTQSMGVQNLIRCVSIKTGKVRMLIPQLANDTVRLKNLGFIKAEIEAPQKTFPVPPDKPIPPPPADIPPLIHKVTDMDTYAKIAKAYGITVKELKEFNNINGEKITDFTALKIK